MDSEAIESAIRQGLQSRAVQHIEVIRLIIINKAASE